MTDLYRGPGLPQATKPFPFTVTNVKLIRDSINQILCTRIGERYWVPDFGSRIADLLFEPNDTILVTLARDFMREAIEKWEPRVSIVLLEALADENNLHLIYQVTIIRLRIPVEGILSLRREVRF